MTDARPVRPRTRSQEDIVFAVRQGALMAVALLVGSLVTDRLRPEETLDRGITAAPFLWAIVVWIVVLIVNLVAFDESQMRSLERTPLYTAVGIGALTFLIGLVSYDAGSFGRRLVYLFANTLGAVVFWWGIISLGVLIARRLSQ